MQLKRLGFTSIHLGLLVTLLSVTAPFAFSQATSTATVAGLVTDEQGAAVVGAEVRLVDLATSTNQATVSNETGRYVIANVSPGNYTINITKTGFAAFKISSQKVDVGTTLTINASLKIGSTSTTIEGGG